MTKPTHPESLIIRPPSEWRSVLVRITRGCAWNRCLFCGQYPHFGQPEFSVRSVEEVKHDIDLLSKNRVHDPTNPPASPFEKGGASEKSGHVPRPRGRTAFFGDADPLMISTDDFAEIAGHLRMRFPDVERLTCYARATTLWKKRRSGIRKLAEAGLDRVHIGLESGDMETLRFHRKGQSPRVLMECGRWLKETGIEVSFYVLLGLGGRDRWKEHIDGTARVIDEVDPEFVRIRRLWMYRPGEQGEGPECPLWEKVRSGEFVPQTPEGTVLEVKRLLQILDYRGILCAGSKGG